MSIDLIKSKEWLFHFIENRCIYRVAPNEEKLPAKKKEKKYSWQFYLRRALFNSHALTTIGMLFWEEFADHYRQKPFQIMGLETGSTPLLVGISMTAPFYGINVNTVSIRAERKVYGLLNRFEGIIDYDLPVLLVDDLCNSKNTMMRARKYCLLEGLEIYDFGFAVVNKDVEESRPDYDKHIGESLKIKSLFHIKEFITNYTHYMAYLEENGLPYYEFKRERYVE